MKRLAPASSMSWQLAALLALVLLFGAALGASAAGFVAWRQIEPMKQELARKSMRVQLLELVVQQRSPTVLAAAMAQPQPVAAAAQAMAAAQHPSAQQPALPQSTPKPTAGAPAPVRPPVQVAQDGPGPAAKPTRAARAHAAARLPAADTPTRAAPGAAPRTASQRIEGVTAENAGVRGLEPGVVRLRNGNSVRVGQRFPSGEQLLLVDPVNNRVVTDKRQMLLFFAER